MSEIQSRAQRKLLSASPLLPLSVLLLAVMFTACGGSSSETPFPEEPLPDYVTGRTPEPDTDEADEAPEQPDAAEEADQEAPPAPEPAPATKSNPKPAPKKPPTKQKDEALF